MSPESSIHHCALAVKRQAQPAVGVLLRKGLLFGDRSPFLYTRAPLPGTGAEPEGPTSRGRGTVRNRRDAKAGRYRIFHIESPRYAIHVDDGVDRTTTYANAPTSVAKRDRGAIRSSPPRRWVGSPRCAVGFRAWSWRPRRRVPSDSAGRIATGRYRRNTVRSRLPSLVLNDLSLVLHQLV